MVWIKRKTFALLGLGLYNGNGAFLSNVSTVDDLVSGGSAVRNALTQSPLLSYYFGTTISV